MNQTATTDNLPSARELAGCVASLEFAVKAKTCELKIADGEIERLKNALSGEMARTDRLAQRADKLINENYLLKRDVQHLIEVIEAVVNRWAGGEPYDAEMREPRYPIGAAASPTQSTMSEAEIGEAYQAYLIRTPTS